MAISDAEKNNSSKMNAVPRLETEIRNDGGVRVVFIGNSITLHGPLPSIGWNNNWGMAASTPENDYAHMVVRGIEKATGRKADVRIRNLADFERNFRTYDFDQEQDLADFRPDYLIVALGENVPELETTEERLEYRRAFKALLGKFMMGRMQPHAVVRGCFWPKAWKDEMMEHAASDFSIPFVRADFATDESNMAIGKFEHSGVQAHPGDRGMTEIAAAVLECLFPTRSGFQAWVDDEPATVRPIRISAMPFNQWAPDYQRPMDQTEIAGMLRFETDGRTVVRVRPERKFTVARLRPLSAGVVPAVSDGEIRFTLPGPGYYTLELDGYHSPLEIFADPKRDFEKERQEANIVFGPGIHEPVVVKLHSHDRVFIDRDACVYGSFQADNVEDVKVYGYGIISGSRNRRVGNDCYRYGMDGAVRIIDSRDVLFDGPVVLDSSCWCVAAYNSSNLEFAHLKVTEAWRYNTDGIDICNSQHVRIHDCFVHSFDDTIVLKGNFPELDRRDPEEDILVERCVCWCGWGRTLEIGLETFAPYFRGIKFRDCDLIHNNGAALSVHMGGPAVIEDIAYNDIRIEYDSSEMAPVLQNDRDQKAECKAPYQAYWIAATNGKMFAPGSSYADLGYDSSNDPYGTFVTLTAENITLVSDDSLPAPQACFMPEQGSSFGDITLNGIRIFSESAFMAKASSKMK